MIRVLFVDDDSNAHRLLKISLPQEYSLISGHTAQAGMRLAAQARPDVVLLDVDLPDADGFEVLDHIRKLPLPPPVIMLTGFDEIRFAVKSMKAGAANYISKPYKREKLLEAIREAAHVQFAADEQPPYEGGFLGDSTAADKIRSLIRRYAASDKPVLVTGESGTGKDLVARTIHELSPRRSGPYVTRNCGAIPVTLFENELFGSEQGAYTDATSRPGSFEQADTGSLFLDELGEMPASSQVKLLRALEAREIQRIGARQPVRVNVRIISATNCSIKSALAAGKIRNDLYYRISTLPLHIPPLRDRTEDIAVLVQHKLNELERVISSEALKRLIEYAWPGNVRELFNVIDRAAILSDGPRIESRSLLLDTLS